MSNWKIIERGEVPETAATIIYTCPGCGAEADLPVVGLPIAQIGGGIVFDTSKKSLPLIIQCRTCRRRFGSDVR